MLNSDINKILKFLEKAEKLKSTLRHNWTKSGRQESAAEHTWRSSLFLILVKEKLNLKINLEKAIKMMIIHDLPESIYGDIPGFEKLRNKEKHRNHKKRELAAAQRLFSTLPKPLDKEFQNLYQELEEKKSAEAKLVEALEKIETMIQHLEAGVKTWEPIEKEKHMLEYPQKAVDNLENKDVQKLWQTILSQIKKELKCHCED